MEKSGEPSSPKFLSSVDFMVPLWVHRQVKPSLDVCTLQEFELIGLSGFGTSLIDSEKLRGFGFFFSASSQLTSCFQTSVLFGV